LAFTAYLEQVAYGIAMAELHAVDVVHRQQPVKHFQQHLADAVVHRTE